jgi:uncharacterized protein
MKRILLSSILLLTSVFSFAQADGLPERPSPPKLVNNLSTKLPDFLSESDTRSLETKLDAYANETSNQVAIVVVDDLGGMEVADYATRLGTKWQVGQEKFKNGVVILIVDPAGGAGTRDAYIAVGYGLESVIPDLVAKRIVENEIIPEFKNGNYYAGLDKAVEKVIGFAKGEYNSDEYANKGRGTGGIFRYIIIAIVIIVILSRFFGRGGGMTMTRYGGTFWGGSFGGGGFGGGGGGGFGGFGGGSFGGGGAGGKW